MTQYSIDIGFNRNLSPHPAHSGYALLSQGVTPIGETVNPVHTARTLAVEDELAITIYDLADLAAVGAELKEMSLRVSFERARDGQVPRSPVGDGKVQVFENFNIFPCKWNLKSTVFEQEKGTPLWFAELGSNAPPYHDNQLHHEHKAIGDVVFTIQHDGYFYYTLELRVVTRLADGSEQTKDFRVDPEMITSGGGGPIDPGGGGGKP